MRLFIRNMTTLRAKTEVKDAIEDLGLHPVAIEWGEIEVEDNFSITKYSDLIDKLRMRDFEIVKDKESILIEKIRGVIIDMVHHAEELPNTKYSNYISKQIGINYTYLSKLFSRVKRITIEHFIIAQKIEKVKELLFFNDLTLSEIAWKLHYSSTAHLSAQFKKVTGLTPSRFKKTSQKDMLPPEAC